MARLIDAWRALEREQRAAAVTALGLFVSMLLPWYSKTDTLVVHNAASSTQSSLNAFEAFSFVEAAVLLISAAVLAMLFARGERRDFQLPGGDGLIVMIAGGWAAVLIFYRLLDKPGLQGTDRITATVGVQWGIFIALLLAIGLFYLGTRMRVSERAQPPLARASGRRPQGPRTGEGSYAQPAREQPLAPRPATAAASEREQTTARSATGRRAHRPAPAQAPRPADQPRTPRGRPRYPPAPSEQMSFEDTPPGE